LARRLSEKRLAAISDIEKELTSRLSYLGMPNARFECRITPKQQPDETGMDDVQFLFSANKNTDLLPVSQIASGGEISRLMLCVKAMIAGATALPTIIFDEIDTGTSGEMADKMGRIMQDMSRNMQVIAITHLPQIASKGDFHYIVYKKDTRFYTDLYAAIVFRRANNRNCPFAQRRGNYGAGHRKCEGDAPKKLSDKNTKPSITDK
jgi:DNA repair protein RecN (Recombination protein N)